MVGAFKITIASLFVVAFGMSFLINAEAQESRIAIVDSSDSTKLHIKSLGDMGVIVIGRYYGRCPQWRIDRNTGKKVRIVPEKRMIDNLSEIGAILNDQNLGILSVYQFYSQGGKFDSQRSTGEVQFMDDRPRKSNPKTVMDFNDCISPAKPNTIEEDAKLDGYAAVTQAKEIIKQPPGTAIYFGVDFNSALTASERENIIKYFRIVSKTVKDAGYVMGVYGNGAISDILIDDSQPGKRLVEYVWLTASPAHEGSAETYNSKHWDILQTKTDTKWSVDRTKIELDTNIQNPKSLDVGFWNKNGSFVVPHDRNVAVHDARRFVCDGAPIVSDDRGESIEAKACTTTFGIAVRALEVNESRHLVRVDCAENGTDDGWMKMSDLSVKRPLWIPETVNRKKAHCSSH